MYISTAHAIKFNCPDYLNDIFIFTVCRFQERSEELKARAHTSYDFSNEIEHLHNRAVQYWKEATDMLDRMKRFVGLYGNRSHFVKHGVT